METPTEEEIDKVVKYLFNPENRHWDKGIDGMVYIIERSSFTPDNTFFRVAVFPQEES